MWMYVWGRWGGYEIVFSIDPDNEMSKSKKLLNGSTGDYLSNVRVLGEFCCDIGSLHG